MPKGKDMIGFMRMFLRFHNHNASKLLKGKLPLQSHPLPLQSHPKPQVLHRAVKS